MLQTLITSKTRLKLLLKFFLNPSLSSYLRELEGEFKESSNGIRLELNRLEQADMLVSNFQGNKKIYTVNQLHPLYNEINGIIKKHYQLDVVLEFVIGKLGNLKEVFITGNISKGQDDDVIDLIFVGEIDSAFLLKLISKAEKLLHRKIRYLIYSVKEFEVLDKNKKAEMLLLWNVLRDEEVR